jgi:predicted P-loop ATPase
MIVEIRANHQDSAPPSSHPEGEILFWTEPIGEPATVDCLDLMKAVRLLATASLIARYYAPPGGRHDWCLALAGSLRSLGLTAEEAVKVVGAASDAANDSKTADRLTEVRTTYAKSEDDPVRGGKALNEIHGSKTFTKSLSKIWGSTSTAFILNEKGEHPLANNQENIKRALAKLEIELSFNVFSEKALIKYNGYSGVMRDEVRNHMWLEIDQRFGFRPQPEFFDVVLSDISHQNDFHPVRDFLAKLRWDGVPRLETWLIRAAKAADTPYVRAVSSLVLIAAVKRVMVPGCKFDELMVLESKQGQLKSSALRVLCPNEDWFSDDLPLNVDSKQIIERTLGKWIIEAADLSGMPKSQVEHLKATLSRQIDGPVRMAYGRLPVERARQFVIVGTTNSHHYLLDGTGNRRFWPVRISKFDVDVVVKEREQLWAEAYKLEREGASTRLLPTLYEHAGMQQERRRAIDPWELHLAEHLKVDDKHRLTQAEVWDNLGIPVAQRDERGNQRLHAIMQRLGFKRQSVRRSGSVIQGWARDADQLMLGEDDT